MGNVTAARLLTDSCFFFIVVGTRAVLIMKVSSGVNIFMRGVFQLLLILDFSSYSALIVKY